MAAEVFGPCKRFWVAVLTLGDLNVHWSFFSLEDSTSFDIRGEEVDNCDVVDNFIFSHVELEQLCDMAGSNRSIVQCIELLLQLRFPAASALLDCSKGA